MIAFVKNASLHHGTGLRESLQKGQVRSRNHAVVRAVEYEDATIADFLEPGPMGPALFRRRVAEDLLSLDSTVGDDEQAGLQSPVKNFEFLDRVLLFQVNGQRIDPVRPLTYTTSSAQTLDRGDLPIHRGTRVDNG